MSDEETDLKRRYDGFQADRKELDERDDLDFKDYHEELKRLLIKWDL